METGYHRRFSRLKNASTGNSLFVALDHGLTGGPPAGFEHYTKARSWVDHPDVDALVMHKGALRGFTRNGMALSKPVILQSNGMCNQAANPSDKPMLIGIEDAIRLGVDAISIEFSAEQACFGENLRALSAQIDAADRMGLPVMVMLGINDAPETSEAWIARHRTVSRSLIELGTSIIKLRQPPQIADWQPLIEGLNKDAHFVMAGGAADRPQMVLSRFRAGLKAGAGGICIGRNVFQHPRPGQFISEIALALRGYSDAGSLNEDLLEISL